MKAFFITCSRKVFPNSCVSHVIHLFPEVVMKIAIYVYFNSFLYNFIYFVNLRLKYKDKICQFNFTNCEQYLEIQK